MQRLLGHAARRTSRYSSLRYAFESLEPRIALSGTPPQVVDVVVSSTEWAPSFISYLETNGLGTDGYSIPVGSSAQCTALPWNNLDQIKIKFSHDVDVQAADLSLTGKNTTSYTFASFFYDPQSCVATWTLSAPLSRDRLLIDLNADGLDPVADLAGNILDGEWTNSSSTYASGNGTAGGDFEFRLNVLPADVNGTNLVTLLDYTLTRGKEGKSTTSTGYVAKYDVDGSGLIDDADWQCVLGKIGHCLPTGDPAGVGNQAPTTTGFELHSITNDAIDVAISLWDAFDDYEDGPSALSYSIVSNSAPSLFDSVSINAATGALEVNTAAGVSGRASISVSATDQDGVTTITTMTIDVDYENQAPEIVDAIIESLSSNTWKVSGTVADVDDDLAGMIIEFSGVFTARAAVFPDGTFEFTIVLEEAPEGWEHIVALDPHGIASEIFDVNVGHS